MWEHLRIPRAWRPALEILDAVVAPSAFVHAAMESSLDGVVTLSAPHPIALPADVCSRRERFRLPPGAVLFATSFELYSPERKNAEAALRAFRQAFAGGETVGLVIRINNAARHPGAAAAVRRLTDGDPRIHVVDEPLSYSGVLSLYASCDVFVSLHRSEGLGLALMESMLLGKPVVATAWSGNMSYMDTANACLVGYRLVPVVASNREYRRALLGRAAVWAEPSVDDAAAWMVKLLREPALRADIGRRAREAMCHHQVVAGQAHFLDQLEAMWRNHLDLPALQRKRTPEFRDRWLSACAQAFGSSRVRELLERHVLWRLPRRQRVAS